MWCVSPSKTENYGINTLINFIMKKLHLLKTVFLLCALVVGSNAWATDYDWVETSLSDLTSSDVFVIVGTIGGNQYSISNDAAGAPVAASVTITGNKITSTVAANIQWNVTGNATDGYTFYPNGNDKKWLGCNTTASSSSNNNMRIGTEDRKVFEMSGNYLVTKDTYTDRYVCVYTGGPDWRGYTSSSTTMKFYKKTTASTDPEATVSKTAIDFGVVPYSKTKSATFTITPAYLTSALSISCDNAKYTVSPASIAEGTTTAQTITVTAAPTALGDNMNGTITISGGGLASNKTVTLTTTVIKPGVDILTANLIGVTSYTDWSGVSSFSNAVYAGNSTKGYSAIQLRNNSTTPSGIVTTASGGKIAKISVSWESHTQDTRTIDVYGKNTPYTCAGDLYDDNTKGTKLGSIVKGTSTELTVTGSYAYIGIVSAANALYIEPLTIEWDEDAFPVTISNAEYATFVGSMATNFSTTGIKVYTATDEETQVTLNEISSGQVPANTPVVLYKAGADGSAIDVPVIASASAPAGTNDLQVSDGTDVSNMYVLAKKAAGVGFYPWGGTDLSAGKIYLQGKASYGAREFLGFGDTTGVNEVKSQKADSQYFNLAGQRVAQPTKGLYLVNGKKVILK